MKVRLRGDLAYGREHEMIDGRVLDAERRDDGVWVVTEMGWEIKLRDRDYDEVEES